MLLMEYPYIRGKELPYNSKNSKWNLFHTYIYEHSQRLVEEYPGYEV